MRQLAVGEGDVLFVLCDGLDDALEEAEALVVFWYRGGARS